MIAGVSEMPYRRFAIYNVAGALIWVLSTTIGGYLLGSIIPDIEQQIHYVIAIIIGLSLVPPVIAWVRHRRAPSPSPPTP
jgi:membrane-associated protein